MRPPKLSRIDALERFKTQLLQRLKNDVTETVERRGVESVALLTTQEREEMSELIRSLADAVEPDAGHSQVDAQVSFYEDVRSMLFDWRRLPEQRRKDGLPDIASADSHRFDEL